MEMMEKHTPGPWEINPKAKLNVRAVNITIANCSGGQDGQNEEQEQANAKLIAAAPELLEALVDFFDRVNIEDEHLHISIVKARAAIKKATL